MTITHYSSISRRTHPVMDSIIIRGYHIPIDLIFDTDCSNVEAARKVLRQALLSINGRMSWTGWDRASTSTPEWMRGYGSPTILIDGADVASVTGDAQAASCRVYCRPDGQISGAPAVETIVAALRRGIS